MHDDDEDRFRGGPLDYVAKWTLYLISALLLVACISAMWITLANAHDAIASRQQPLGWSYDYSCCNLMDCREVADAAVKTTRAGYVIVATGEVIPFNDPRIKRSKDEFFHWCSKGGREDSETICLYKPDAGF